MKRFSRLLASLAVVLTLAAAIAFSSGGAVHAAPSASHSPSTVCGYTIHSSNPIYDNTGYKLAQIRLWVDTCSGNAYAQIVDATNACINAQVLIKYGSGMGNFYGLRVYSWCNGQSNGYYANSWNTIHFESHNTCAQGEANGWFNQSCN